MKTITPSFIVANFFNYTKFNQVKSLDLKLIMKQLEPIVDNDNTLYIDWGLTEFNGIKERYADLFYISYLNDNNHTTVIKTTDKFESWDMETRNTFINDEFNYNMPKKIIDKTLELIEKYKNNMQIGSHTRKIKPCDCQDIATTKLLNEQGVIINNNSISVSPNSVILEIGHTTIKIPMSIFKTFSEWYLREQQINQ